MVAILGATIISSFSVTIVMAQELFPKRLGTASGTIAGFAIGTGGIGVTLLGVVADRFGVPFAVQLINGFPVAGALFALLLPLPWKSLGGGHPVDRATDVLGECPPKAPAP
jgi:FSR family fosmidomycin resistance protein-like MFS transporter